MNYGLKCTNLCVETIKPFDVFDEGLYLEKNRGDMIRTCDLFVPNEALYQAELHPEWCMPINPVAGDRLVNKVARGPGSGNGNQSDPG